MRTRSRTAACIAAAVFCTALATSASPQTGPHWSARFMPPGMNGSIRGFTVSNGTLITDGGFSTVSGVETGAVARWDGRTWSSVGHLEDATVSAIGTWGDAIVAFVYPHESTSEWHGVYRWDGTEWLPFARQVEGFVERFLTYRGVLLATAWSQSTGQRLFQWTGTDWVQVDLGLGSGPVDIDDMTVWCDRLVACGHVYDDQGVVPFVSAWDGAVWHPISGASGSFHSMAAMGDKLLLAGDITLEGGSPCRVAAWDGTRWMDCGFDDEAYGVTLVPDGPSACFALGETACRWDGASWTELPPTEPYALGLTRIGADLVVVQRYEVRCLRDGTWQSTSPGSGPLGYAVAVTAHKGDLFLGGGTCGSLQVPTITRWDGARFTPFTEDMWGICGAFAEWNGEVYAGGRFHSDHEMCVLRLDDADGHWHELGELQGTAYALLAHDGALHAGGAFGAWWGDDATNVRRWDGTAWTPLGGVFDDDMFALGEYRGELIAGGRFTSVDGATVRGIARWDGTAWRELGGGVDGDVNALLVHDGRLFAGGRFTRAGTTDANAIAVWDGTSWSPVGENPIVGRVWALAEYNGTLVAGGSMRLSLPADTTLGIARWDGTRWRSMDGGVPGSVHGLVVWGTALIVAGELDQETGYLPPALAVWEDAPEQSADGASARVSVPQSTPVITGANADAWRASVAIYVPREATIRLDVVDARGARVADLMSGPCPPGHFTFDWPVMGSTKRAAASGVYWVRLAAEGIVSARRVVLLRGPR